MVYLLHFKTKKIFLLSLLCLIITGCAPLVYLNPTPPSGFTKKIGSGKNISLFIGDYRKDETIFRVDPKLHTRMWESPIEVIWNAYNISLTESGYNIVSSAPFEYKVEIEDFYVTWPVGFNIPVTGEIKIRVKIQKNNGSYLINKVLSHRETEVAKGGGAVGKIPNNVLQKCLNEVIKLSLTDRSIMMALESD